MYAPTTRQQQNVEPPTTRLAPARPAVLAKLGNFLSLSANTFFGRRRRNFFSHRTCKSQHVRTSIQIQTLTQDFFLKNVDMLAVVDKHGHAQTTQQRQVTNG